MGGFFLFGAMLHLLRPLLPLSLWERVREREGYSFLIYTVFVA
jgi:hypothetical protein